MPFQSNTGLNVNNYYGPRVSGGGAGPMLTDGYRNEYTLELPMSGLSAVLKFPEGNGIRVTGVDLTFSTGPCTSLSIGGINVFAASDAAPVLIPQGNTGLIIQTGGLTGKIVIQYKNVAGDATH